MQKEGLAHVNFKAPAWVKNEAKAIAARTGRQFQEVLAEVVEKWVRRSRWKNSKHPGSNGNGPGECREHEPGPDQSTE